MLCTIASPLMNLLVHRTHHKYADTNRDSHSPTVQGWREAWFGEWMERKVFLDPRVAKREVRARGYQLTHKYYVPILAAYAFGLWAVDWKAALFLYAIPAALLFHVKGFFNTFGHTWGYRNHETDDDSRNSWLVNIVTVGDGWHNNHHADPSRWNISERWYEVDFAAWFIQLIRRRPQPDRPKDLQELLRQGTKS
jgi:stearoyl-CoA desaturase (delta-9 desaturase)